VRYGDHRLILGFLENVFSKDYGAYDPEVRRIYDED
jgi:hypothetical protein